MDFIRFITCRRRKSLKLEESQKKGKEDDLPSQFELWRFYFKFMKINWISFFLLNSIWIFSSIVQAHTPFVLLDMKQSLIENNYPLLKQLIFQFLITQAITQAIEYYELRYHWYSYQQKRQDIQKSIITHLFSLDLSFFEDNKVSSLSKTVQEGADQISEQLSYGKLVKKINQYIEVFSQLYFIYYQSGKILLVILLIGFINSGIYQFINSKKSKAEKNSVEQSEYKDFALDDIITNMQVIKIFRSEKREISQLDSVIKQNGVFREQSEYYNQIKRICINCSHDVLKVAVMIQILVGGLSLAEERQVIANTIAEVISYVYSAIVITKDISKLFNPKPMKYYKQHFKYIAKLYRLFQVQPTIDRDQQHTTLSTPIQYLKGDIIFSNVSFQYPISHDVLAKKNQQFREQQKLSDKESLEDSSDTSSNSEQDLQDNGDNNENKQTELQEERRLVLKNVNFEIKSGQFVAFVGMSGSGKSTIVKLMERYYDINQGSILFDGQNIKDISLDDLRGSIGLVNQEPSLFDNDIEYNITYGCRNGEYTQEELRQICDVSGVSEFVFDEQRFPEGLKTLVGSRGQKLSGGQKQRIAIARALIKKPSILILDEATSSLDSESEHLVQKYIDKLVGYRGITIIVIAHRLSTIAKSDLIFVMQDGQIKESGNHTQLLAQAGVYKKLIHHQINFQIENTETS